MAAPGFGFSAGDFITALNTIAKVAESVSNLKGASAEYNLIFNQLRGLENAIRFLQRLQPNEHNAAEIEAVKAMAFGCMVPLRGFLHDIEKYDTVLGTRLGWKHGCGDLKKAQWGLFMEKKITKVRSTIDTQILSINMLLNALQMSVYSYVQ